MFNNNIGNILHNLYLKQCFWISRNIKMLSITLIISIRRSGTHNQVRIIGHYLSRNKCISPNFYDFCHNYFQIVFFATFIFQFLRFNKVMIPIFKYEWQQILAAGSYANGTVKSEAEFVLIPKFLFNLLLHIYIFSFLFNKDKKLFL